MERLPKDIKQTGLSSVKEMYLRHQCGKCFAGGMYVANQTATVTEEPVSGFIGSTYMMIEVEQVLPLVFVMSVVLFKRFLSFDIGTGAAKTVDKVN